MLQTPKATVEVKELEVDISKDSGSKPNLFVKLHILPVLVHMGEPRFCGDQSSSLNYEGCLSAGQSSSVIMERSSASFVCEEFSLSCEFGHDRYCLSMYPYFTFYVDANEFTERVILFLIIIMNLPYYIIRLLLLCSFLLPFVGSSLSLDNPFLIMFVC